MIYCCGQYIKLLSFKTLTSVIVYKNLKEITSLCIVKQSPNIVAFGTVSGAIKDFDMKSKKIVRTQAKLHKKSITSLHSEGKYLISCSSDDNLIIVYDYSKQEEHCEVHLPEGDFPCEVVYYKTQSGEHLLIGSIKGQLTSYDLQTKSFGLTSLHLKSKIIQIKPIPQSDKVTGSNNIFAALS